VHSVCALSAKLEKFTWKQDEGNNNFGPLSSPFRLFFFWFLWFFLFFLFLFSVLLAVPSLSSLSSPSPWYSLFFFSVPLPFSVSLLSILCFLTLSPCLSLFSFFSKDFPPSVSFSLCYPVLLHVSLCFFLFSLFSSLLVLFFSCLFAPLVFHHLSLAFISQRMPCGATFGLVTTCRGIVAVKHSL